VPFQIKVEITQILLVDSPDQLHHGSGTGTTSPRPSAALYVTSIALSLLNLVHWHYIMTFVITLIFSVRIIMPTVIIPTVVAL
jgi:hypothetical protein